MPGRLLPKRFARGQVSAQAQATAELVLAGILWGFGFIATIWALAAMEPLALTGWRFMFAAVFGFAVCFARPGLRRHLTHQQFLLAAPPGLLLSVLLMLQTWGLKYTTATKSSFITTLYVLFVPILESTWLKRRLSLVHYLAVAAALIGTLLICDLPGEISGRILNGMVDAPNPVSHPGLNFGDFITFLAALVASVQILWFGLISRKISEPFAFNAMQSLWAGLLPWGLAFWLEPIPDPFSAGVNAWIGFLSLAFGATMIAFALQARAQRVLSPSLASLLFLLESPFATFFAVIFLGESLLTHQWLGAGLILLAAGLSTALATED